MKGKAVIAPTRRAKSSISTAKRASRSSSWTPKTARMITARVIRVVCGRIANGSSTGQLSISRRVISTISSPYPCTRSPWKGGSSSLRWRMWGASSRVRTEFGPSAGSSTVAFASPAWKIEGAPVNTSLTRSGRAT